MSNGTRPQQLRLLIAQQAARLIAEDGTQGYAHAKRKAARQVGASEERCLPTNAEIEQELRLYHEIYRSAEQPLHLQQLRGDALEIMRVLERFNPHLVGAVLDGTAGRFAETEIHLYADSAKEVELFLLNRALPYQADEITFRYGQERRRVPVFVLEGAYGIIRLLVLSPLDLRNPPRYHGQENAHATVAELAALLAETPTAPDAEFTPRS